MSELETAVDQTDTDFVDIPEDYADFVKFRETGEVPAAAEKTPAAGDEETPQSESSEEKLPEGQSAADPEPEGEAEQEQAQEQDKPEKGNKRLARRMRQLTGQIAELQSRLDAAESGETVEETPEEAASSTETAEEPATAKLTRPMLKDFEDTEDKSAWDQYEEAMDTYNGAIADRKVEDALERQRVKLETEHAKQTAQAEWNRAASRYPNYNEVVARPEVKISAAMESVMRMDPESGTALAYYLGEHPEDSERIAKATLATSEREWGTALARAGLLLGEIRSTLGKPGTPAAKPQGAAAATAKPAPNQIKKVSTANRPPSQIKGRNVPGTDVMSDDDAANYKKWVAGREAQLRKK
jgi:hypothetical protein